MRKAVTRTTTDAALLKLGAEFDRLFEEHLRISEQSTAAINSCDAGLRAFAVPIGTERYWRLRKAGCGSEIEALNASFKRLQSVVDAISAAPATSVEAILIKAKTLPFDLSKVAEKDVPLDAQDYEIERLYAFIDEIEALAYGRIVGDG